MEAEETRRGGKGEKEKRWWKKAAFWTFCWIWKERRMKRGKSKKLGKIEATGVQWFSGLSLYPFYQLLVPFSVLNFSSLPFFSVFYFPLLPSLSSTPYIFSFSTSQFSPSTPLCCLLPLLVLSFLSSTFSMFCHPLLLSSSYSSCFPLIPSSLFPPNFCFPRPTFPVLPLPLSIFLFPLLSVHFSFSFVFSPPHSPCFHLPPFLLFLFSRSFYFLLRNFFIFTFPPSSLLSFYPFILFISILSFPPSSFSSPFCPPSFYLLLLLLSISSFPCLPSSLLKYFFPPPPVFPFRFLLPFLPLPPPSPLSYFLFALFPFLSSTPLPLYFSLPPFLSDGTSMMSDSTSVMSDVKIIMGDGRIVDE